MKPVADPHDQASDTLTLIVYLSIVLLGIFVGLVVYAYGSWAWLMRDGLGPNAIETSGSAAIVRTFWCMYFGPVSLVIVLTFCALVFAKIRSMRKRIASAKYVE